MSDYEREDMELAEMMGEHFTDATKEPVAMPEYMPEPPKKVHALDIPVEEQWQPKKPEPTSIDKLKAMTKDFAFYATASMILFWWQQSGRLDYTTAWYALLVCVGMVFFSIGKHWGKK